MPPGWDREDNVAGLHLPPRPSRVDRPPGVEGQQLPRTIDVNQNVQHIGTEVTLVTLELLDGGFVTNFMLAGWGPGSNPLASLPVPGFIRSPTFYANAVDDQGKIYQAFPGSGGGGRGLWKYALRFSPGPASADGHLHVTIEEIQWMPNGAAVRSLIEPGPWEFDISLELLDEPPFASSQS